MSKIFYQTLFKSEACPSGLMCTAVRIQNDWQRICNNICDRIQREFLWFSMTIKRFGKEAIVLKPEYLHTIFKDFYAEAFENYAAK